MLIIWAQVQGIVYLRWLKHLKGFQEKVPYKITERRPGDVAICFADASKAKRELGWEAKRGLEEMCADSWRWQSNNKNGYLEV